MIAIPIAVIETPPMANSTLHHPGAKRLSEVTCGKIIAFPHPQALSCFIQSRFVGKRLMELRIRKSGPEWPSQMSYLGVKQFLLPSTKAAESQIFVI